ncbi:MAG: PRC-barrel domain-containing protein [Infirmifilum sp.]
MSTSRSELIGKSVYDQEAKLIGTVQDIAIKLGEKEVSLLVRTPSGVSMEIPADKVLSVKDIILLKEAVQLPSEAAIQPPTVPVSQPPPPVPVSQPQAPLAGIKLPFFRHEEKKICPYCGKPATYIPQYKRWYCYNCQRYID